MKKITLSQIAENLDISVATVSRIINKKIPVTSDLHKEIIRQAEDGGYLTPTISREIGNIGLVFVGLLNKTENPVEVSLGYQVTGFYGRITLGVDKAVTDLGGNLLIKTLNNTEKVFEEFEDFVKTCKLEGAVISLNGVFENIYKFNEICPCVIINHYEGFTPYIDSVCSSNFGGTKKIFDYLLNLGHKRIALWTANLNSLHDLNRIHSYYTCIDYYKIDYKQVYYDNSFNVKKSIYDRMDEEFHKYLKDDNTPTAIMCTNDTFAYVLCDLARKHKIKVPGDLSITGFDDVESASLAHPAITTLNSNLMLMGKHAIHLLTNRIYDKNREHIQISIEPELIIRESTGKA